MKSKRKDPAAVSLGRRGGLSRSPAKVAASKKNAAKAARARRKKNG
jgi:hypothetical protein